jgi:hypothetical protein
MGFQQIKQRLVQASTSGRYCHEYRTDLESCNKLATGEISTPQVLALLRKSVASDFVSSPHPADRNLKLNLIRVGGWLLQFYFLDDDTVYTAVHKQVRHA